MWKWMGWEWGCLFFRVCIFFPPSFEVIKCIVIVVVEAWNLEMGEVLYNT